MGVQVPCEHPPFKENWFIFYIYLYKLFISADAVAHDLYAHFSNLAKSLPPANTWTVHEPPDRLTPFRKKDTVIYHRMIHCSMLLCLKTPMQDFHKILLLFGTSANDLGTRFFPLVTRASCGFGNNFDCRTLFWKIYPAARHINTAIKVSILPHLLSEDPM